MLTVNPLSNHKFYTNLARHSGTALICDQQALSYLELERRVEAAEQQLKQKCILDGKIALLALPFYSSIEAVITYLAALRAQIPVLLLDPELTLPTKEKMYQQLGVGFEFNQQGLQQTTANSHKQTTNKVALLLSTSGSSGSPKTVMLTAKNLNANTESITQYLPMQATDVAITTLPLHYSYGLSVLNTHLAVGATLVLTEQPLMSREFWQQVKDHQVTSLSGVPFHYQMLQMLRLERMELPAMRYLTQAGGKLDPKAVEHFSKLATDKGWAFFVMYGQTEATARMAYVPTELIAQHPNVIGQAIPGGRFEIRDLTTQALIQNPEQEGELHYFGANVMLGYAQTQEDWLQPPVESNSLATGDLACWTEENLIKITGRLSRFIKIRGKRLQLDHLEEQLKDQGAKVYCCGQDDQLFFVLVNKDTEKIKQQIHHLATTEMNLHPSLWQILAITELPYLTSGKVNYSALLELCLKQKG